jgi:hypothetical protein
MRKCYSYFEVIPYNRDSPCDPPRSNRDSPCTPAHTEYIYSHKISGTTKPSTNSGGGNRHKISHSVKSRQNSGSNKLRIQSTLPNPWLKQALSTVKTLYWFVWMGKKAEDFECHACTDTYIKPPI